MLKNIYECIKIIEEKTKGKCIIKSCDNIDGIRIDIIKKDLEYSCIYTRNFLIDANDKTLIEELCYTFNNEYNLKVKEKK